MGGGADSVVSWRRAIVLAVALTGALAPDAHAHPLHTTLTELTEDRSRGTVRAVIRVFADDFGTAVARHARGRSLAPGAAWDAAAFAYVASTFTVADRAGRGVALRSCGVRRTGELLWICVEGATPVRLTALTVRNAVLTDLFDDQVNVVQAVMDGARRSVLFTRGDRAKTLS